MLHIPRNMQRSWTLAASTSNLADFESSLKISIREHSCSRQNFSQPIRQHITWFQQGSTNGQMIRAEKSMSERQLSRSCCFLNLGRSLHMQNWSSESTVQVHKQKLKACHVPTEALRTGTRSFPRPSPLPRRIKGIQCFAPWATVAQRY
jgi:hypothetical protein